MMIHKAYKFRIYPNQEQQIPIAKTIGCSRFVFNRFLSEWNKIYKETGKGLSYNACSAKLTLLKKEEGDTLAERGRQHRPPIFLAESIGQLRPLLQETEQLPPLQEQKESGAVVHDQAYERKYRDCREQVETP